MQEAVERELELEDGLAHLENLEPHSIYLVRLERGGEVVAEQEVTTRQALPSLVLEAKMSSASSSRLSFVWEKVARRCREHRGVLGGVHYTLHKNGSHEVVAEGEVKVNTTRLEVEGLQPATSYSLELHLTRQDGRWEAGGGSKLLASTLPQRDPPSLLLLLLLLPAVLVLLGLLIQLLLRCTRRRRKKQRFQKEIQQYLEEEGGHQYLRPRSSCSSSSGTTTTYVTPEPEYATIQPRPRGTVDPLPPTPRRYQVVVAEVEVVPGANHSHLVDTMAIVAEIDQEDKLEKTGTTQAALVDEVEGYSKADFGRPPRLVGSQEAPAVIPLVSYGQTG